MALALVLPSHYARVDITEADEDASLRVKAEDCLLAMFQSFYNAWPFGTSATPPEGNRERFARLAQGLTILNTLCTVLTQDDFETALPLALGDILNSLAREFPPAAKSASPPWFKPLMQSLFDLERLFEDPE